MPCWEVQSLSVEFHAEHLDLLKAALKALGISFTATADGLLLGNGMTLDLKSGRATLDAAQQQQLNAIKREYSRQAIKRAALRNRWNVRAHSQTQGVFVRQ